MADEVTFDFEILPDAGTGGESGGSSRGDGGTPAGSSKTDALEARLDRLSQSVENFISGQRTEKVETERSQMERAFEIATERAKVAVDDAEAKLATAFDSGEGAEIAAAQRALSEATAKRERVDAEIAGRKRDMEAQKGNQQVDTTQLDTWKTKHASWYGTDATMTRDAHAIGKEVETAGIIQVGTPAYFEAIDKKMRERYPDKLGGSPSSETTTTSGAGHGRPTDGKVRFTRDQVDTWRKMGIDTSDPETMKRMAGHRVGLVDRGILPQEPVRERVR